METFAGDRGFDPLGLAKPTEYLQVELDELDQNAPKNVAGGVIGEFSGRKEQISATESLQPYNEVCVAYYCTVKPLLHLEVSLS